MDNVWHIFLVNCRPFVLIGNLINPKCLRKSLGFIHWTNEPKKEKKFSLFSNPIHPIKKKKNLSYIFGEREEENKGNEPCGGLRLERDGTEREDK